MAPAPVAVVIVSWNSAAVIGECIASALHEQPQEIVVIDNGSHDATVALVRASYPDVRVVALAENVGFATGCNRGVAQTSAPYVLFLNDDARLQPGYLSALVQAFERDPCAASATGKLVSQRDGMTYIDSAGIELGAHALRPLERGHGERDHGQYDIACEIFGPSGAAAMFRRAAFDSVHAGPFDDEFFAYYEDVDLSWRLTRAGWTHLYVPCAVAEHGRRGPGDKPPDIAARAFVNRYATWVKNESLWRFCSYAPVALPWEAARLLRIGLRRPATLRRILQKAVNLPWRALRRAYHETQVATRE